MIPIKPVNDQINHTIVLNRFHQSAASGILLIDDLRFFGS